MPPKQQPNNQKLRVLFICIGNACRSPMAEAIARQDAGDVIDPSSAGLIPLGHIPENTVITLRENGYSSDFLFSKAITSGLWQSTDLFINLSGETIERSLPESAGFEDWDIADPFGRDLSFYQRIFGEIHKQVAALAVRLRQGTAGPSASSQRS